MTMAFVGRQPIYTPGLRVAAYEVLFRDSAANASTFKNGDQATAELILNIFTEIGIENIVGHLPAFINVTRNFIVDGHAHALPKDQVVIEVLEDVAPDPDVLDSLRQLSYHGYRIALDDFVYSPELRPLVEIADIVKVELPAIRHEDLAQHVRLLRKSKVKLLAEKVETYQDFERCKQLGFDYFQGYFFCQPKVIQGSRVPVSRMAALQLLTRLRHSNVTTRDLAQILSTEPMLCYKLLRFVNSAACGLTRRIDSIQAAVTLVGLKRMHSFTRLAILASVAEEKPPHLLVTALTRARMCELLAEAAHRRRPEAYFVAGMFSVLDALLDKPMVEALEALPLEEEIRSALLDQSGPIADIVHCVVNYDQADFDQVHVDGLNCQAVRSAYLDALGWAADASLTAARLA